MIRAIFFDLDGTLIERGALWLRCIEGFLNDHRATGESIPFASFVSLIPEITQRQDLDRRDVARLLADSYPGLGLSVAQIAADFNVRLPRCVEPNPPVLRMLADLSTRYVTAIVTNGSARMQRAKLARAGLDGTVGRVFISGDLGSRKPDAGIFQRALSWSRVPPDEALMVGDDSYEDIHGASRAGLRTCRVGGPLTEVPIPDFQIPRVIDLPRILS
ncbi:MAG: HAD family hydrolase [Isosphaeraceae bacterium]